MKPLALICLLPLLLIACDQAANPPLTLLTEEYPPLSFAAGDEVRGQAVEVVQALLERTGGKADMRLMHWERAYQQVLTQENTALFTTVMTPQRKPQLQWVGPINALDTNLYALRGANLRIRTLEQARNAGPIATVTDYYSEQMLKQEGFDNLVSQPDVETAIRKLLDGEVRLFVSNNTVLPALLQKVGADMSQLEIAFTVSSDLGYIAFSPSTPSALVAKWQQALDAMKRDGSFDAIYAKWLALEIAPGILQMMTEEYPPVTFLHQGRPAGFATDMVREIAARLAYVDNIRLTSWRNAYRMAQLHPNVLLFSAERTPERETLFQWVGPVGKSRSILFARAGSGIRLDSLDDARKLPVIATTTDWFTEQLLQREGFGNLLSSRDPTESVRLLMSGEAQLSIFTDITVPEIAAEAGYHMADLEPVLTVSETDIYLAFSRDTPPAVVAQWQQQLDEMKRDGSFERIYKSYLPENQLPESYLPEN